MDRYISKQIVDNSIDLKQICNVLKNEQKDRELDIDRYKYKEIERKIDRYLVKCFLNLFII